MIESAAPWTENEEQLFRRDVLLNAPEKASHLELAAMSIRELASPAKEPYRGEERRRGSMR